MATAFDLINGNYVTLYARAADPNGANYWVKQLGFSSIAAASAPGTATLALADALGPQFYAASSTVFDTTYPKTILNSEFINKLYLNLGGLPPDSEGATFWLNRLNSLQGSNPQQVARSIVAAEIAFTLQTYDPNATGDAAIRAQTFKNKITVSENVATTGNASFNPASQSMSDPAYAGETNILLGITNTAASLNTALAQVSAANAANNPALMTGQGGGGSGGTYVLTTGIDLINANAPNVIVIGQYAAAPNNTMNPGDQINLTGTGNLLTAYGVYDNTQTPVNMKNVQTFELGSVQADANLNFKNDGLSKATTGIVQFKLDNVSALNAKTVTTGDGQGLWLSTGASGVATAGNVTWAGSTTDTSLNLTLFGYQGGSGVAPKDLIITGAAATTLNINSITAKNAIGTLDATATTTKVVITGDKLLKVATDFTAGASATAIKTIDASADTGGVDLKFANATNALFSFKGGSGDDALRFDATTELSTITSGAQLDGGTGANTLYVSTAAFTAANYTTLGQVLNFQTLGLTGNGVAYDASQVTGIKQFAIASNNPAWDTTITKIQAGSSVNIQQDTHDVVLNGDTGVSAITVKVGTASSAAITVNTLSLPETTVALSSVGKAGVLNTITTLNNADNSNYTITGTNDLTITNAVKATAVGSVYDATALTGKLTIIGNTTAFSAGSSLGDIIKGGAGNDTITASVNSAILTGGAGTDAFSAVPAVAGTTTAGTWAFTTITDLAKGETVALKDVGTPVFTSTKVDVSTATTLNQAVDLAAQGDGSANGLVRWFQFGGNTYVVDHVSATSGLQAVDDVVKVTGLIDLSSSTVSAASVLTYL